MTGLVERGGGVVDGYHVERTLEGMLSQVGVLFRRPRRATGQVVGRTWAGRNGSGGEVERIGLRDLHKVDEISLVKGRCGKEVGGVEYIFAGRWVGIDHGGCDAGMDLKER